MKTCPKCQFKDDSGGLECPRCGIVYGKYKPAPSSPPPSPPPPPHKKEISGDTPRGSFGAKEATLLIIGGIFFSIMAITMAGVAGLVAVPFIFGSSAWVFYDATTIGVRKNQIKGAADMGPVGWFFGCLFVWIIAFPLYLSKRGVYQKINSAQGGSQSVAKCPDCGYLITSDNGHCEHCGSTTKGETGIRPFHVVLAMLIIMVIAGMAFNFVRNIPVASLGDAPSIISYSQKIVTFDEYSRIETGMTYREVASIIGSPGEETAHSKVEGIPGVMDSIETVSYQWVNNDGSNMQTIFQNNRLDTKAQFGL